MQNEIINNENNLKTCCQNFARAAGMYYNQCVSLTRFPSIPSGTGY